MKYYRAVLEESVLAEACPVREAHVRSREKRAARRQLSVALSGLRTQLQCEVHFHFLSICVCFSMLFSLENEGLLLNTPHQLLRDHDA